MGWKAVKEHYGIEHIVHMEDGNILIGSPYVRDLITITPEGKITTNIGFKRYVDELQADIPKLLELMAQPDTFEKSITVFTYRYSTAEIIEKQCEALGWPNVTHDGELMYDGKSWSTDRAQVIQWAIEGAEAAIRMRTEIREQKAKELAEFDAEIIRINGSLVVLKAMAA